MGKHKTQRTDELRQATGRYLMTEQAQNHIEQHNFDKLVAQGIIVEGAALEKALPPKGRGVLKSLCPPKYKLILRNVKQILVMS